MADEDEDAVASRWTVKLESVERLDSDDPDNQETFSVAFQMESPNINGSASVMVSGIFKETRLIGEARDILGGALERWARVMARGPDGERTEPTEE